MSGEYLIGLVVGIIVGVALVWLLLKKLNTNGKAKTNYDERQKLLLIKGYKAGFYTMAGLVFLLMMCSLFKEKIQLDMFLASSITFFVPLTVTCCVNIWNGAYFGINNNAKQYCICFAILSAINIIISAVTFAEGEMIIEGGFQPSIINFECAIMILVVLATIGCRKLADKKEEDE